MLVAVRNSDMPRERSLAAFVQDTEKVADNIMEQFSMFTEGTRVLLLLRREKEGGSNNEHRRRRAREVVHDREQYRRALIKLLFLKALYPDSDYRIYASASPRDIRKAELQFKTNQLLCDFEEKDNKKFFYENFEEKWISALMASKPPKGETMFVLDVDVEDNSEHLKWLAAKNIQILFTYRTKNGWHIVVEPFNVEEYPKELGEVKKDGLLLLAW
jgi:hypothetical protein